MLSDVSVKCIISKNLVVCSDDPTCHLKLARGFWLVKCTLMLPCVTLDKIFSEPWLSICKVRFSQYFKTLAASKIRTKREIAATFISTMRYPSTINEGNTRTWSQMNLAQAESKAIFSSDKPLPVM